MGRKSGGLCRYGCIQIIQSIPVTLDPIHYGSQHGEAGYALVFGIGIREMLTDIAGAQGPDYCIDNGMGQDIRI